MAIEVEARSFISKKQYEKLLDYFRQNAKFIKEDYQKTFYFDCKQDLRIQRNNFYAKIWLKKGKIHDESREELEIKFSREDFENLKKLFLALGFEVQIKWFRKRFEFLWDGVTVCLDFTNGYGYIIELEKMCAEQKQEGEFALLLAQLKSLGIEITPREEFEKKFSYYKKNWKTLID